VSSGQNDGAADLSPADALLVGAIDIHHHGYPEISFAQRTRYEDVEELSLCRAAGMAGIVLKSHMWPTVGRAYHINKLVPGVTAYPSVTLNPIVGGLNPLAVESAAAQGARVVFMPTWGAAHDVERGGMSRFLGTLLKSAQNVGAGLRLIDGGGRIKPEVDECLAVAAQYGMAICSGHISPRETMALAVAAKNHGIESIVFQHPDSHSVGASRAEIIEIAGLNALVEICALGTLPAYQRISPNEAMEIINEITPARAILTTDYFFDWAPSAPETLRMLIGIFLSKGMSAGDITTMVRSNPERLLGLGLPGR
jgi:hypothetical protein